MVGAHIDVSFERGSLLAVLLLIRQDYTHLDGSISRPSTHTLSLLLLRHCRMRKMGGVGWTRGGGPAAAPAILHFRLELLCLFHVAICGDVALIIPTGYPSGLI